MDRGRNPREVDWWEAEGLRAFSTLEPFQKVRPEKRQPQNRTARGGRAACSALCVHFLQAEARRHAKQVYPSPDPQHLAGIHLTPSSASGGGQ